MDCSSRFVRKSDWTACCLRKRANLSKLADNSGSVNEVHAIRDGTHGSFLSYLARITSDALIHPYDESCSVYILRRLSVRNLRNVLYLLTYSMVQSAS